ncbi:MAG: potassium channel family protein [Spirochaetales bacterium]|nr:potassium channel family protein [Spirochaetales bacterium]
MLHKSRFRSLTLVLVVNFILNHLLREAPSTANLLGALLYTVIAFALIWAYGGERRRMFFLLLLNLILVVFRWSFLFIDSDFVHLAILVSASVFFIALIQSLFKSLISSHEVDADTLYGSVAIYFLLGNLWNSFYVLIRFFDPEAFVTSYGDMNLLYYSFVTLVGLGYGDIVPVSSLARLTASLEGITGTLYVAIVISRVVGLYISERRPSGE